MKTLGIVFMGRDGKEMGKETIGIRGKEFQPFVDSRIFKLSVKTSCGHL